MIISNKEFVGKLSFNQNNYNKYKKSVFDIISINSKLNNICELIKSIHDTNMKNEIIKRIDGNLDEYR